MDSCKRAETDPEEKGEGRSLSRWPKPRSGRSTNSLPDQAAAFRPHGRGDRRLTGPGAPNAPTPPARSRRSRSPSAPPPAAVHGKGGSGGGPEGVAGASVRVCPIGGPPRSRTPPPPGTPRHRPDLHPAHGPGAPPPPPPPRTMRRCMSSAGGVEVAAPFPQPAARAGGRPGGGSGGGRGGRGGPGQGAGGWGPGSLRASRPGRGWGWVPRELARSLLSRDRRPRARSPALRALARPPNCVHTPRGQGPPRACRRALHALVGGPCTRSPEPAHARRRRGRAFPPIPRGDS